MASLARRNAAARPPVAIDVTVEAGEWPDEAALRDLARPAIEAALAAVPAVAPGSEVSLVFTDDPHIAVLNRTWRDKDGPTNVLSFPGTPAGAARFGPMLGDIIIARETVEREAGAMGLTFADHLTHLLVHGFLHLVGHDHQHDAEADVMERLEAAILAGLGIADPYAGTEPEPREQAGPNGP